MAASTSDIEYISYGIAHFRPGVAADIKKIAQGFSHGIYLICLQDSGKFVARVTTQDGSEKLEKRALNVREHLRLARPKCKVPDVLWHNLASPQDHPIIVFEEFVEGDPLSVWNLDLQPALRSMFLDSLSSFLLDLWSAGAPTNEPRQANSYGAWLEGEIDRALRRCVQGTAKWGDTYQFLAMRSMIPRLANKIDNDLEEGIAHGDMNAHNFIVNTKKRLQGVVDWDWAFVAPLPAVVQFPWFIADIPGWHNDGVSPDDTFEKDRDYLVEVLRSKEIAQDRGNVISELLSTSRERQHFQAAISFKDIHFEFARSTLVSRSISLPAVKTELDFFLKKHPDFQNCTEVLRIKRM